MCRFVTEEKKYFNVDSEEFYCAKYSASTSKIKERCHVIPVLHFITSVACVKAAYKSENKYICASAHLHVCVVISSVSKIVG
jgi:hypothetical protein